MDPKQAMVLRNVRCPACGEKGVLSYPNPRLYKAARRESDLHVTAYEWTIEGASARAEHGPHLTPLVKMHTLGSSYVPPGFHAGGLRYHGESALISQLYDEGLIDAIAIPQTETFEAGVLFARTEGIVPAPESCHAVAGAIREAKRCKETGEAKTLLFNLSGHGHFDMSAYERFLDGELKDFDYPAEAIAESLRHLPKVG